MRARDLLPLTNDAGSKVVLVANPVNVQAAKRAVDFVICLRRGTEEYVRHLEFQARHRGNLARRFFEYASGLTRHYRRPVLTTVIYVGSPAPSELVYRQVLAGRVVNQWRFDVVRLWEQPPERLLALGPGGAALVPLCAGATLPHVAAASRSIQRGAPPASASDLLAILQMLLRGTLHCHAAGPGDSGRGGHGFDANGAIREEGTDRGGAVHLRRAHEGAPPHRGSPTGAGDRGVLGVGPAAPMDGPRGSPLRRRVREPGHRPRRRSAHAPPGPAAGTQGDPHGQALTVRSQPYCG